MSSSNTNNLQPNIRVALLAAGNAGYAIQLAQGLSGFCERLLFFQFKNDAEEMIEYFPKFTHNLHFQHILFKNYPRIHPLRYFAAVSILSQIIRERCNVVHIVNSGASGVIFHVARLAKLLGIAVVFTIHDAKFHPGDILKWHLFRLNIITLEQAHQVIVHGKQIAEVANQNFLIPASLISIIPHGNFDIYLEHVEASQKNPDNKKRILLFGRMKKYKGLDVLEQCAPILAEAAPEATFVIAGRGPELDKMSTDLARHPNIEIHNKYCTAAEAGKLFSTSSIVILPYIEASQSGPLCIAFSFSKPIVASSVGSLPEVIDDGINGLLVPPGDPQALANALLKLLKNPDISKFMGDAGRRKSQTDLLWSGDIAKKTIDVYNRALNNVKETKKGDLTISQAHVERWTKLKKYYWNYRDELVNS